METRRKSWNEDSDTNNKLNVCHLIPKFTYLSLLFILIEHTITIVDYMCKIQIFPSQLNVYLSLLLILIGRTKCKSCDLVTSYVLSDLKVRTIQLIRRSSL
ncbi:hypothetical protein PHYBLDRAFT_175119 [Phycomyces blakesleeanus NRRL 1555(-)]|uniref:Uncharacterized protein n=1 Tax=Phycomyces blakesleeanus (strain ATCC 8743b / DSM 1359 / FGSC 10004 / NBRC 33097 / NRRL 1555) TaxID=763407 RepID=A0A167JRP3_PHYB8|nr:hypothetical protein PHYBLDRAFT_175119 [Phycomyces blakesleeanus NRRL 1555(-)]OAD66570.1 hypothetical protein PHYBLDRAFT_175119 [Phycomyces blakesleeanus NRRL 1555(-)]|eukprot:XP_018284610.1 hypothetical protein PHYBLDRAFT_175119 [Phycomyces blakesleeanus NRRL 1555(-)]